MFPIAPESINIRKRLNCLFFENNNNRFCAIANRDEQFDAIYLAEVNVTQKVIQMCFFYCRLDVEREREKERKRAGHLYVFKKVTSISQ